MDLSLVLGFSLTISTSVSAFLSCLVDTSLCLDMFSRTAEPGIACGNTLDFTEDPDFLYLVRVDLGLDHVMVIVIVLLLGVFETDWVSNLIFLIIRMFHSLLIL